MKQSRNCYVLFILVFAVVVATKESDAFMVMTGQAVRLTKPPLPKSAPMASTRSSSASPLHYRNRDDEAETQVTVQELSSTSSAPSTGLRIPIVGAIAISQVLTITVASLITAGALFLTGHNVDFNAIHWNWGNQFNSLFDFTLTPWRLVEGVLAATPIIYVGTMVENSDHRDSSHVNFSTMNAVMTLFGRRRHWWGDNDNKLTEEQIHPEIPETSMPQVLVVVAAIAILTGFCEEIVFRGEIPFLIALLSHSPLLALFGQALLFGVGHLSRRATVGENNIVAGLQSINGLWYGLVYLLAGGDVLPCIIAHTLYDSHVFMETWMRINDQMDYTDEAAAQSLSKREQQEIALIKKEAGPQFMTDESLEFTRRFFYAFDYEHKGSLSRSDLQRAVSYAFLQDPVQPTQARVNKLFDKALQRRKANASDDEERLSLADFLRVLVVLKGNPHGARA